MKYLTLTLALLLPSVSANAQEMKSVEIDYGVGSTTKKDCPRLTTAGEATGVGVSSALVVGGIPTLVMGLDRDLSADTVTRSKGMVAAGATMLSLGIAGLVTSTVFLVKKRRKKAMYEEGMCGAPVARHPFPGLRF